MRRLPLLLSLLVLVPAVPLPVTPSVHASAVTLAAASDGAQATAVAERLRPAPPVNFPMSPTPRCYILDNFGDARSAGRSHEGSDMMATLGQEVYAMADGTLTYQVVDNSNATLSGNLWNLKNADGSGTYYTYAHLSAFAPGLSLGSKVVRGQVIGFVGDTGNPGPGNYHLHFELHPGGGAAVNPLPFLTIPPVCSVV